MTTPPLFEGFSREIDTTERHHIEWTFDRDHVSAKCVCESGPDARCHLICDQGCESWSIERDQSGAAFHYIDDEETEFHLLRAAEDCNVDLWLNDSDIEELALGRSTTFVITRTPITPSWEGDHYLWEPATEAKS